MENEENSKIPEPVDVPVQEYLKSIDTNLKQLVIILESITNDKNENREQQCEEDEDEETPLVCSVCGHTTLTYHDIELCGICGVNCMARGLLKLQDFFESLGNGEINLGNKFEFANWQVETRPSGWRFAQQKQG